VTLIDLTSVPIMVFWH